VVLVGLCTLVAACATSPKPRALDGDGDGIPDDIDECPQIAEDEDGVDDRDGCPEYPAGVDGAAPAEIVADADGDGVPDDRDVCRDAPEDRDGFEDDDGCPDADNDHDRILDADDKCPNEPETYNGEDDDDGCPDRGTSWFGPKLSFVDVPFIPGHRAVELGAVAIVDGIAAAIVEHCLVVELQGHASDDERRPRALAAARADAVRAALRARGVPEGAVKAVHKFGASKPLCSVASEDCRARNRRVKVEIVAGPACGRSRL
jgi:outer membrane protein OmpA-like peptidoglycan-associated protein